MAVDVSHETLLDGEPGDLDRHRRKMIERILTQYEDLSSDDLDYLLNNWAIWSSRRLETFRRVG